MQAKALARILEKWKGILLAIALVLSNGVILSRSGLLSYTHFTWEAFAQSYTNGEACETPSQCLSDFCVDGVCCDTACTQPGRVCARPGAVGVCSPVLTAPALGNTGQALAVLVLIGGALLGWRLRRREE